MVPVKKGSGMILEWNQRAGIILAAGDSRTIRPWDAHRECAQPVSTFLDRQHVYTNLIITRLQELPTLSESPVTAMAFDPEAPTLFMASFGDGSAHLYDRRCDEEEAIVRTFREHSTWIQAVRWQPGSSRDFVSARYGAVNNLYRRMLISL